MSHVASHFAGRSERERVLGFAVLLALADRRLARAEQDVLVALGGALGFSRNEVQIMVHRVAFKLEQAMAGSQPLPAPPPLVEEEVGRASTEPAAPSRADAPPPGSGDTAPAGSGDTAPAGSGDTAPAGSGDTAPAGSGAAAASEEPSSTERSRTD
jgi:hypothetical protein